MNVLDKSKINILALFMMYFKNKNIYAMLWNI